MIKLSFLLDRFIHAPIGCAQQHGFAVSLPLCGNPRQSRTVGLAPSRHEIYKRSKILKLKTTILKNVSDSLNKEIFDSKWALLNCRML